MYNIRFLADRSLGCSSMFEMFEFRVKYSNQKLNRPSIAQFRGKFSQDPCPGVLGSRSKGVEFKS